MANEKSVMKILVCTHREFELLESDCFLPIHVGRELSNLDLPFIGDNTGDNISCKNKNYCELTAMYWAWKNLPAADYVGFCHYRRYFLFKKNTNIFYKITNLKISEFLKLQDYFLIDFELLKKYDFVVAEPMSFRHSVALNYIHHHSREDFDVLKNVIFEYFPDYVDSFDEFFNGKNEFAPFNMIITDAKKFNDYCHWLFKILFEVEKRVTISPDAYQARIFGFMGERLLNLYLYHNNFKVKYLPVVMLDDNTIFKNNIVFCLKRITKKLIFNLCKRF